MTNESLKRTCPGCYGMEIVTLKRFWEDDIIIETLECECGRCWTRQVKND